MRSEMNNTSEKKRTDYKTYGLDSPIARTLDVVGDRWTLLIIRDLLDGHTKYQDLLDSLQGISTNLLAERLNRLVEEDIVTRALYNEKPPRAEYHLTEQGQQLAAVVDALFEWGVKYRSGDISPKARSMRDTLIRELGLKPEDIRVVKPKRSRIRFV